VWHWTSPHGRSGGILLGVYLDLLDVGGIEEGDFFVKFRVRDKKSDFKWVLVAVYGAAQPEFKESFLTELVQSCSNENLPLCIGGDFNIIRNSGEKNNDKFEERWPSFSTRSLIVWTRVNWKCRVASSPGPTLVGYLHMRGWTGCWSVRNGSKISH
jgi:hypothetical protein